MPAAQRTAALDRRRGRLADYKFAVSEPEFHWQIERGKPPVKAEGRRRASYFYRVPEHAGRGRKSNKQPVLFEDAKGEEVELEIVNLIRERVKEWRDGARSGGAGL